MRLPEPYGSWSMKRFDPGEPDLNSGPILRKFQYCTLQSRRHQWCHPVTSSRAVASMYSWGGGGGKPKISDWRKKILNISWHTKPRRRLLSGKWRRNLQTKIRIFYIHVQSNARCPMEKSKGHWTFHLSNGSNGPPIFHWTFACPLDLMDKWNVHWPAMDQSELCINRIRDHVKVADRNNASTG
jgi:hypothetical protein